MVSKGNRTNSVSAEEEGEMITEKLGELIEGWIRNKCSNVIRIRMVINF